MQVHPQSHFPCTPFAWGSLSPCPMKFEKDGPIGLRCCKEEKKIPFGMHLGVFCQHFFDIWYVFSRICVISVLEAAVSHGICAIYAGGLISILGVASCYPVGRTLVRLSHINWLGSLASFGLILWYHPQTVYGEELLLNFLIGLIGVFLHEQMWIFDNSEILYTYIYYIDLYLHLQTVSTLFEYVCLFISRCRTSICNQVAYMFFVQVQYFFEKTIPFRAPALGCLTTHRHFWAWFSFSQGAIS